MLFIDDAIGNIESLTSAPADIFRGEEWIEDAFPYGFRNTVAGIADMNFYRVFNRQGGDGYFAAAFIAFLNGVGGVNHYV